MALSEDEAEAEVSVNTKVPSCGRWNSGKLLPSGLEPDQPLHLGVEGGHCGGLKLTLAASREFSCHGSILPAKNQ